MAVATLTPTRLTVENSEIQLGSAVTDTRGEIIMNLELLIDLMSEATIDQVFDTQTPTLTPKHPNKDPNIHPKSKTLPKL